MNVQRIPKIVLALTVICFSFNLIHAQYNFKFDHLTTEDGLLDNMNFAIFQDSKDYIWIGGRAGLQRYDGYEFVSYTFNLKSPQKGLPESMIRHITESNDGTIWAGTAGGGIVMIKDGKLLPPLMHNETNPNSLAGSYVEDIIQDRKTGGMWFATDKGLDYFLDGTFTHFIHSEGNSASLSDNRVFSLYQAKNGDLWVGTQNGLNLHLGNGRFRHFLHDPKNPESLGGNFIHDIMGDESGNLWLAIVQFGLNRMRLSDYTVMRYVHDPRDPTSIGGNVALDLDIDPEGNVWVASYGGGLSKFSNGKFEVFQNNPLDVTSILNNNVEEVMVDRAGNIWTANYLGAVNRFAKRPILSYSFNNYKEDGMLPMGTLNSLLVDRTGAIWLGISSGGLNRYYNGKFEQFPLAPDSPKGLGSLRINDILEDKRGRIWISNHDAGADMYENGSFTHFSHDPKNPNSIHNEEIIALAEDNLGGIWFGSNRDGISVYRNGKFTTYVHDPSDPNSLRSNNINGMNSTPSGAILIATEGGLSIFENGAFTSYRNDLSDPKSIPIDNINTVVADKRGIIWVGFNGGLAALDRTTGDFKVYDVEDGLAGPMVEDLSVDIQGGVWIATHDGASRFNPDLNQFENYTTKNGFINNSILRVYAMESSSRVYFGGGDGFYYLDLNDKIGKEVSPALVITDFVLSGQFSDSIKSVIREKLLRGEDIELKHNQNTFEIKFAALSSEIKPNHIYSYRMKNLDEEWSFGGNSNKVSYTFLEPGDYIFEVRLMDAGKETATNSLEFTILAPWWKTIWFRSLLLITFAGAALWIYQWRIQTIKQDKLILETKILEATTQVNTQNQKLVAQSLKLQEAIEETKFMVKEAAESGNFSARLDTSNKSGEWKDLGDSINQLFDSVVKPFNTLNQIVNHMAEGDLTGRYHQDAKGDALVLARNLNVAMESLCSLLGEITSRSEQISSASDDMLVTSEEMTISTNEIANAISEMSTGAQQQVERVDESSNLIEEILKSSNEMGDQADSINSTAKMGVDKSNVGMTLMSDLDSNMKRIQEFSKRSNESIGILTKRSGEISGVLRIIKEIASQTNLLALNAAIEASKAGEAGLGFGVVAEEIRKLAEGSKQSAAEIEKLVFGVQTETNATATLIEEMNSSIKAGGEATLHSMKAFKEISAFYDETLHKSEQIVEATKQQTADIGNVVRIIGSVVVIAEETAAGTEQTASSSSELSAGMANYREKSKQVSKIAQELREKVGEFKLS